MSTPPPTKKITFRNSRLFPRFLAVAFCALAWFAGGSAYAGIVLSNIEQPWANGNGFAGPTQVGLGFATGSGGGKIDAISFSLLAANFTTSQSITYSVLLYAVGINNLPSGSYLSIDTGVGATWTNPVGGGVFQQQTFSYSAVQLPNLFSSTLAPNTKYAIVLGNQSGATTYEHYWALASSATSYSTADGFSYLNFVTSSDSGASWAAEPSFNGKPIASISVAAAGVPEPGTWAAAALLIGGVGVSRWRWRAKIS